MASYVKEQGIPYPVAVDIGKKTTTAFRVDSHPDYYLIDRAGKLRVADLQNADLERAVGILLKEKGGKKPAKKKSVSTGKLDAESVLATALQTARAEKKKVLVHLGAPG